MLKTVLRTTLIGTVLVVFAFLVALFTNVHAASVEYTRLESDYEINSDSTVIVTEKITMTMYGEQHARFRDLMLDSATNRALCQANTNLVCGGLGYMEVLSVTDSEGKVYKKGQYEEDRDRLNEGEYTLHDYTDESGDKLERVQWVFSKGGRNFAGKPITFTLKYKLYGSLGFYPSYEMFYWNVVWPDREASIKESVINIKSPKSFSYFKSTDLIVYGNNQYKWNYNGNVLTISMYGQVPVGETITVMLRFPKDTLRKPATLNFQTVPSQIDLEIGGITFDGFSGKLLGVPSEEKTHIKLSSFGYHTQEFDITLKPGEVRIIDNKLEMTWWFLTGIILWICCNSLGCLLLPLILWRIYWQWHQTGRDVDKRSTIVPIFQPPKGLKPYLMGALKDERVDIVDITSSIIDLAYRGYLKIRELESAEILGIQISKNNFEFTRTEKNDGLSESEEILLDEIFNGKERVTLKDLEEKFYRSLPRIKEAMYKELVTAGYFAKSPQEVRENNLYAGVGYMVLGVVTVFSTLFTVAVSLFVGGIVKVITSAFMPAKTALGSKTFVELLGFKMYLEAAERYRLQNLTPEIFEKFLSYAMVFGVEKKWAETFKDIYNIKPDWYESDSGNFNSILLANSLRGFNSAASSAMVSTPQPKNTGSTGGGWSGGGGFGGGFSGGGGGGGGSGGW